MVVTTNTTESIFKHHEKITLQEKKQWSISLSQSNNTSWVFMHDSDYWSKIISWFPSVQPCNWVGFRISLSLSREGAIFRDEIENYFSCSRLARRDRDYHMTILVFRDENEIPFCYSHVSRLDRDFRKSFLAVEREKWSWLSSRIPGIENSRWPLIPTPFIYHRHHDVFKSSSPSPSPWSRSSLLVTWPQQSAAGSQHIAEGALLAEHRSS